MKKFKLLVPLLLLFALISAGCGFYSQADAMATSVAGTLQSQSMMETSVAATVAAMLPPETTPEPPVEKGTAPIGDLLSATCGHISISIDPLIATGYTCDTIPEEYAADMPYFAIWPKHDQITLDYAFPVGHFHKAQIIALPIERYKELIPNGVPAMVEKMNALIGGAAIEEVIPYLPYLGAAQVFHSHVKKIENASLSGFRFITLYSQAAMPINNHELFYAFQGITHDGKLWISVILPTTNAILPENGDTPPGGDWAAFSDRYEAYLADITMRLEELTDDSYNPSLILLDSLVAGIMVNP